MMNNSLTKSEYIDKSKILDEKNSVKLLNPLSKDLNILRQRLLFGGLEVAAYNQNRRIQDVKIFEFGKTYFKKDHYDKAKGVKNYYEEKHLALFATGRIEEENWNAKNQKADFYFVKGLAEAIMTKLGIDRNKLEAEEIENDHFRYGLQLKTQNNILLQLGSVAPQWLKYFDIKNEVFVADFNWDTLMKQLPPHEVQYEAVSKLPSVRRDLALVVDKKVSFKDLQKMAFSTERKLLQSVGIFDVYEGDKIPEGKKSYALSFVLQDKNKTLTDKVIEKTMRRLQQAFEKEMAAGLR